MEAIDYVRAIMWIIGIATSLTSMALGGILAYHWNHYATDAHIGKIAMLVYITISVGLIIAMFAMTPAF